MNKDSENKLNCIERVVVRSTNWVGDAVMTIPALRRLRELLPNAQIALTGRSWVKDLFEETEFVDELLISDRRGLFGLVKDANELRKREFDLAVIFPNSFSTALTPALAGIHTRIGYATDGRGLLLQPAVSLPEWKDSKHESEYYLNIIDELERYLTGAVSARTINGSLTVSGAALEAAQAKLAAHGIESHDTVIAICPGSINSRAKRWPTQRYAAVSDRLINDLKAKIVLIGSPDEVHISSDVVRQMEQHPISLTGRTTLAELIGILSLADLLITNDTGPAHISAALGRPTLVIFGPTNPLTTRPMSANAEILRNPPDCAPCMLRDCPIDHRCMTAVSVEDVFHSAASMLRQSHEQQSISYGSLK